MCLSDVIMVMVQCQAAPRLRRWKVVEMLCHLSLSHALGWDGSSAPGGLGHTNALTH